MPCYEPPTDWDAHGKDFYVSALCHALKYLTPEQIGALPGLAEWKHRHDAIDAAPDGMKWKVQSAYDEATGTGAYDSPLFMRMWRAANPKDRSGGSS